MKSYYRKSHTEQITDAFGWVLVVLVVLYVGLHVAWWFVH